MDLDTTPLLSSDHGGTTLQGQAYLSQVKTHLSLPHVDDRILKKDVGKDLRHNVHGESGMQIVGSHYVGTTNNCVCFPSFKSFTLDCRPIGMLGELGKPSAGIAVDVWTRFRVSSAEILEPVWGRPESAVREFGMLNVTNKKMTTISQCWVFQI